MFGQPDAVFVRQYAAFIAITICVAQLIGIAGPVRKDLLYPHTFQHLAGIHTAVIGPRGIHQ